MVGTGFTFYTTSSFSSFSSTPSSPLSFGFSNPSTKPSFGSGTASYTTAAASTPFGGSSLFGSSPFSTSNLFGSSTGVGFTSNICRSSSSSESTPTSKVFGCAPAPSTFGSSSTATTSSPFRSSLFGSAATSDIHDLGHGFFGSSTAASASSPFGASLSGSVPSSNLFGLVSAPNVFGSSSAASASIPFGSSSLGTGNTASMFGSSSATVAGSPSPSSSPFGTSALFASPAPGSSNLPGSSSPSTSSPFGVSGLSSSNTTAPSLGSGLAPSSNLFGSSLFCSSSAPLSGAGPIGPIPESSVFGSSTPASTAATTMPLFDVKSPAGGLFSSSTPSSSTTVASMGNTPSFGSSFGSTLDVLGSSSSIFSSYSATLSGSLSSTSASPAPELSFATASGFPGNASLFGSSSGSILEGPLGSSSMLRSSPAPLFSSLSSSSTAIASSPPTNASSSAPEFSFASASGSPGFSFPAASATGLGTATTTPAASFSTVPTSASSDLSFLKSTTSLASAASSTASSASSGLTFPVSIGTSHAVSAPLNIGTSAPSSGFSGFSTNNSPALSSGATSSFSLSLKSPVPVSSALSQLQSFSFPPSFGDILAGNCSSSSVIHLQVDLGRNEVCSECETVSNRFKEQPMNQMAERVFIQEALPWLVEEKVEKHLAMSNCEDVVTGVSAYSVVSATESISTTTTSLTQVHVLATIPIDSCVETNSIVEDIKDLSSQATPVVKKQSEVINETSERFSCKVEHFGQNKFGNLAFGFPTSFDYPKCTDCKLLNPCLHHTKSSPYDHIIRQIFFKYGDITKGCILRSTEAKSAFLHMVAEVVVCLCNHTLVSIGHHELDNLKKWTDDAAAVGFHVEWLQQRIKSIVAVSKYQEPLRRLKEIDLQINAAKITLFELELQQIILKNEIDLMKTEVDADDFCGTNLCEGLL